MLFLYLLGGFISGSICTLFIIHIFNLRTKTVGILDVDTQTKLCRIRMTSDEVANPQIKKVLLTVKHDVPVRVEDNDYNEVK